MQFAYQLLIAALSLLTTVANNPNVSADLKAQATLAANQAITYAQSVIQQESTPMVVSPTPTQTVVQNVIPTPVFGSVTPVSIPTNLIVAFNDPNNINFPSTTTVYGGSCSPYNFYVTVKDQNGQIMNNEKISLLNPDTGETILANNLNYTAPVVFNYTPQKNSGSVNLTFIDGNISTTTSISLKSIMKYDVAPDGTLLGVQQQKGIYVYRPNLPGWVDTTTGMCVKDSIINNI